ncbi:hypothetical protein, partial [Pontibacillus salipaludis]|uniref:hypothetical protein n=1 Tax=Pontibacillus salipaludis TaxID=1697394 RepID=UPI0031E87B0F
EAKQLLFLKDARFAFKTSFRVGALTVSFISGGSTARPRKASRSPDTQPLNKRNGPVYTEMSQVYVFAYINY